MSVNHAINKLLNGSSIKDVVEDLAKLSAHTAARLMHYGEPEAKAIKIASNLTGQLPDDELLQQSTKNFGIGKTGKQKPLQHWIRQGAYNPASSGLSTNT